MTAGRSRNWQPGHSGVTRRSWVLAAASGVVTACAAPGGDATPVKLTQPVSVTLWTQFWTATANPERLQAVQDMASKWNSMKADGPKVTLTVEPIPTGTNTLIEKVTA